MLLSTAIDSINEAFEDSTFLQAMDYADTQAWSHYAQACNEADNAQLPDLSDLHTILMQDDIIERDENVLVEYFDIDGQYGHGIVRSWHTNPYDLYNVETDEHYAFIEGANGTTYAHFQNLNPICEVNEYETTPTGYPLPALPATVATSNQQAYGAINNLRHMYQLQYADSVPTAIGA